MQARRLMGLVVALGVGGGVLAQLYRVAVRLLDEQGLTTQWTIAGRPVHAGGAMVVGALAILVVAAALWSRFHEDADERALRKAIEKQRKQG